APPEGDSSDPVMVTDELTGTIYYTTLRRGVGVLCYRSFNGGATFTSPVEAAPGFDPGDDIDKEWLAVDNFPGTGRGNVYHAFRLFDYDAPGPDPAGIYLTATTDGGDNWGPGGGVFIASEGAYNVQTAWVGVA